jgi:predicted dehydrogenase
VTNHLNGTSDGQIRWGILGTGFIAGLQTQDLADNGFTVQAVGSRNAESSKAFSEKFGIPTAHGSYEALVADPEVDVVYVASPHTYHHAHALLALNAGKHVLVEKPFTINAREAQEIFALAEAKGLVALEAMWSRFLPHMARLREIIQEGTLGEVRKVTASHNQDLPKDPAHRLNDPALGGGALLDLGVYPVSVALDVLGTPKTIRASASMTATGVDRQTAAIFEYPQGQQALIDCALDTASNNRAAVIGTEGWIDIESTWYNPTAFTVFDVQGNVLEKFEQPVNSRGMQFQAAEMERLVNEGAAAGNVLPPGESMAVMAVMDEIRRQIGLKYGADAAPEGTPMD